MAWRLGIDLGTNSLGWAAIKLVEGEATSHEDKWRPAAFLACGTRIFSDGRNPKSGASNAEERRGPRGHRKNMDRKKRRQQRLMRQLITYGLMPDNEIERKALQGGANQDQADFDPWILRCRALEEALPYFQFGRAIFHLHQRRGFKSNRKTDKKEKDGAVSLAVKATKASLEAEGARTLGELYGRRRLEVYEENKTLPRGERKPQPLARVRSTSQGSKLTYDYYPTRAMILDEFDQIWQAQKSFHGGELLSDEAYSALRDTIEFQHPLKPQPVGKCILLPDQERAPKALPTSQRARVLQEVNHLRIRDLGKSARPLTLQERDLMAEKLLKPTNKKAEIKFESLHRLLGLSRYQTFSHDTENRKCLVGDKTSAMMRQKDLWGDSWFDVPLSTQDEIIHRVLEEEDEHDLINWLMGEHGLSETKAATIADITLPDGHGNLSAQALQLILPYLEADVCAYHEAVERAGLGSHSNFSTGEVFDSKLPYYGKILTRSVAFGTGKADDSDEKRYGKVANPTVHVALNQLGRVVNDLMSRFGSPEQIVLELSRELPLSAKGKSALLKQQGENFKANEERRRKLAGSKQEDGYEQEDSYDNRLRLRLYDELPIANKICAYTGQKISPRQLFSAEIEIDHILPYSRTLDNTISNKVLCFREANQFKGNKTPYEAFGNSPTGYDWEVISRNLEAFPNGKAWRFGPDAMESYLERHGGDFLARQLNDTKYIARLAKSYVEAIYGGQGFQGSTNRVWAVTGRLTSDLRHIWGLNTLLYSDNLTESEASKKNRNNHRHHALDAAVIACTDRSMLQRAAQEAGKNESLEKGKLLAGTPAPWQGFRDDLGRELEKLVVSHKPDHGYQGAMHNDTAYGFVNENNAGSLAAQAVVSRKPLSAFSSISDLDKIRDEGLKQAFQEAGYGLSGKEFTQAIVSAGQSMKPPVYKVRVCETLSVIAISDKSGKPYKGYKGDSNYCYDIWEDEKGRWTGEVISTFEAYQLARQHKNQEWWRKMASRHGKPLLFRLRKNDMLQIEHDGELRFVRVVKMSEGTITLTEHFEANVDARSRDKDEEFDYIRKAPSSLQKSQAKFVTISPSGSITFHDR